MFLTIFSSATKKQTIDIFNPKLYDEMTNIRVCKKYGLDDNRDAIFLDEFSKKLLVLSEFSKACVEYIAAWVVRKLVSYNRSSVKCEPCKYNT